ncbi:type II secretion system protein [Pseudoalteromonas sp. GB56]
MNSRGFTLVELIITMVLIGVLAVTVVPRFIGSATEDAYMLRDRTIAMMRAIQLESMHNVNSSNCVKISSTLIAPPAGRDCANAASTAFDDYLVIDSSASGITFTTTNNQGVNFTSLAFDSWGKPNIDCSATCKVAIANQAVCVSGEGLIYACE